MIDSIIVRDLAIQDYLLTWHQMRQFTDHRNAETPDEIWLLQHPAVFTQGQAGHVKHLLNPGDIPVVQSDRGGQVTYHGPGQLVIYTLIDITRRKIGVRQLVRIIENSVIAVLKALDIEAHTRCDAPGVYVAEAKICSVGLRVRHGYTYHGLALNIDMDLSPFTRINPCGFVGLRMTQISEQIKNFQYEDIKSSLVAHLRHNLVYTDAAK